MKAYILKYLCSLEGRKTQIKELHWGADNLSQHKLCDDVADAISEIQDKIAEVEQSISGKFKVGNLKGQSYKTTNLITFLKDVIDDANTFHAKLEKEGDKYKGMKSDVEAFLSDAQRLLYLADFTVKESLKERLRNKINEGRIELTDRGTTWSLTENELRELTDESIRTVLKKRLNEDSDNDSYYGGGLPDAYNRPDDAPNDVGDIDNAAWEVINNSLDQAGIPYDIDFNLMSTIYEIAKPLHKIEQAVVTAYREPFRDEDGQHRTITQDEVIRFIRESMPNVQSLLYKIKKLWINYGWLVEKR